jgi:hypothetical protein
MQEVLLIAVMAEKIIQHRVGGTGCGIFNSALKLLDSTGNPYSNRGNYFQTALLGALMTINKQTINANERWLGRRSPLISGWKFCRNSGNPLWQ